MTAKSKPAAKRSPQSTPAGKTITRQDDRAWWCPYCDTSNTLLTRACGRCGATRDGDKAVKDES